MTKNSQFSSNKANSRIGLSRFAVVVLALIGALILVGSILTLRSCQVAGYNAGSMQALAAPFDPPSCNVTTFLVSAEAAAEYQIGHPWWVKSFRTSDTAVYFDELYHQIAIGISCYTQDKKNYVLHSPKDKEGWLIYLFWIDSTADLATQASVVRDAINSRILKGPYSYVNKPIKPGYEGSFKFRSLIE